MMPPVTTSSPGIYMFALLLFLSAMISLSGCSHASNVGDHSQEAVGKFGTMGQFFQWDGMCVIVIAVVSFNVGVAEYVARERELRFLQKPLTARG
jgi:hypothetical protein